jgi:hypothetical protein
MYSAVLLFIWAAILSHLSVLNLAIGVAVTSVVDIRVVTEERLLRARYPEYRDYARSTKALVPFVISDLRRTEWASCVPCRLDADDHRVASASVTSRSEDSRHSDRMRD